MKKFSSRIRAFLRFTIEIKNGCEILFRVKEEERKLDFKLIKRIKPSRVKYLVVNRFNLIRSFRSRIYVSLPLIRLFKVTNESIITILILNRFTHQICIVQRNVIN